MRKGPKPIRGPVGPSTRTRAFGLPCKPRAGLVRDLRSALSSIRHEVSNVSLCSPKRNFPLKRLKNNLVAAMSLDTAMQPVGAVVRHTKPNTLREGKHARQTVVWNPIWDIAPGGAFFKAKKVCGLLTDICMEYRFSTPSIEHDLERLSINIWRMPKRHFKRLCGRIRAKLAQASEKALLKKNPEAAERIGALTANPSLRRRGRYRRNRRRICRHGDDGCAAMQRSYKVGIRREILRCTKCIPPVCAGSWCLTPAD